MSEAIKPLDPQALIDLFPQTPSSLDLSRELELLEGDALYAPADVTETPVGPVPTSVRSGRRVPTLTNSPGCEPDVDPQASDESTPRVRTMRRARSDAWSLPAPAHWGRARRPSASVRPARRVEPGKAASRRGTRTSRSSDWALPF